MITFRIFITNYLEPFSLLVYFVGLWVAYRRNKTLGTKQLAIYYLVIALLQLGASLGVRWKVKTNIWLYETVAFLTITFISRYFYHLLQSSKKKKAVIVLWCIYIIYALIRQFTIEGVRLFDSFGYSILSASIAIYVFMYFHQMLQKVTEVSILKDFSFWLASSYLVYFVGCFIIFVSYYYFTTLVIKTYTKQERALLTNLWGLHNVLLFIGAASFLIGSLWINSRRKLASS